MSKSCGMAGPSLEKRRGQSWKEEWPSLKKGRGHWPSLVKVVAKSEEEAWPLAKPGEGA